MNRRGQEKLLQPSEEVETEDSAKELEEMLLLLLVLRHPRQIIPQQGHRMLHK